MKKWLFLFLSLTFCVLGLDNSTQCFKDLGQNFFDQDIVAEALSIQRVWQSQWLPIYQDLEARSGNVHEIVVRRGEKMRPNPVDYPFNAEGSMKILLEVLREQFFETMSKFQVGNAEVVQEMFDYVVASNQQRIDACIATK